MTTKFYRTRDFFEAAVLVSKGHVVLQVVDVGGKALMVFEATSTLHQVLDDLNMGRLRVEPLAYAEAVKDVKGMSFRALRGGEPRRW